MILNDEVSSNSVVKRVIKHFTVLINVPKKETVNEKPPQNRGKVMLESVNPTIHHIHR